MASAPRFRAEQELYRSHRTIVELGERGGRRVVVKRSADPSVSAQRRRAAHEAHLLGLVRSEYVIACYSAPDGGREDEGLLLLEHLDGATLAELPLPLPLPMFYEVAIDACRALSVVHEAQIIHKDINPSNFVRTRSGVTKLIDFDIATRVTRESGRFRAPSQIEGTLLCIAPEQTGRTNRVLDLRADLYSLGATFYWLLTGRPPFEESDPLALLHRHIAERPKPITATPPALDRIVQRLLAKNAEDRYQSARGVERDLVRAREGTLDELGRDDVPHRLVLPSRVLGREREARALCAAFDAMHEDGSCKIAFVAGYSGVGKTSLVREVHKPLTARAGYFLRGKLDPFDRNTPYAALALALEGHVQVLLSEPVLLEQYKQRLKSALSARAGELVRGFPALEPLLGPPQAPSADGGAQASDPQAMGRLLQRLFSVLASRQHPLVIFFDDLQWADPATLAFIERSAQVGRSTLIVGAYRDNEVGPGHPLRELIARLSRAGSGPQSALALQLTLEPLGLSDVTEFVAETLHRRPESVAALSRTLHERTGGNPYFLGQTLLALEQDGVIERRDGAWSWDEARASLLAPTEHIADVTAQRLANAPASTRALLHVMACVGNEIEAAQIEALLDKTSREAEALVEEALYEGFVTLLEPGRIAFLHDRVRLAAYELGSEAERRAQHRRIATAYLREPALSRGQRLFETVTQLQAAFEPARAAEDPALSDALIEHSLLAARRAHGAGAFELSLGYARACREVLAALARSDSDEYRAATSLYGDAHYSLGNLDQALRAYDELLALERDPVRRSAVYQQKAVVKTVEGELGEAYGYFVLLVRELGFDFNTLPTADEAAGMVAWARDVIAEIGLAELEELPRNEESLSEVLIEACSYFGTIAYAFRPESFKAVQSYTLIHCFDFGVPPSAPPMITAWAYCAASIGDYNLALEVARAGCRLAERHSPKAIVERARTLYAMLAMHYEAAPDEHLLELRACADRCAAHGDLEYAAHARSAHDMIMALTQGAVAHVFERVRASRAWASELHIVGSREAAERTEQHLTLLRGGEASARASVPELQTAVSSAALHGGAADARDIVFRTAFGVLVGDYPQAALSYARLSELRAQLEGSFTLTLAAFYGAIALHMTRRRRPLDVEETARLASAIAFVGLHAEQNPRASGAYAELLAALGRADETGADAGAQLERAIEAARLSSAPVLAALGAALAADLAMERGQARVAHSFAEQASREYVELGMFAAVRALQRSFARVGLRPSAQLPFELEGTSTGIDPRSLDLWSALRASQALAAELHVEPLISRLLGLAREAAGAQRVVLVSHAQLAEGGTDRVLSVVAELDAGVQIDVGEPLAHSTRVPVPLIERAMRAGDARVVHDATRDAEWSDLPYFKQSGVRSALCVPIGQSGSTAGALYLENALAAGAFDAGRVEVLRILASQAAVSLQNAKLLREEAEKDRLHREMETAAHIQRALVPIAPRIGGFEVAVHMTPADQVGGDYYDVLHAGGGDWFVCGDVSGHGLPAGLVMIICQTALHAVLQGQPDIDPAHALSQVNRLLSQSLERFQETKYVAITLFRHVGDGVIEYAGLHEDIVIYRKQSDDVEVQQTAGTWLGVVPDLLPLIPVRRIKLAPGDTLALYTDGVIDARQSDGSKWGQAGLVKLLRDCGGLPLETIKARVLGALAKLRQTDDITLFLLRR